MHSDHLLMRVTAGWRIVRRALPVLALLALGSTEARAETMRKTITVGWEDAPRTNVESIKKVATAGVYTLTFIRIVVPGGSGELDQLMVYNDKTDMACMASGSAVEFLSVRCGTPDAHVRLSKANNVLEVEWVWETKDETAPKAPTKPRVLPLPRGTVRS